MPRKRKGKSTAVAKRNNDTSVAKRYGNVGVEDVAADEGLGVSFVKLVQKTSDVPGADEGDLVDSQTNENFGDEIGVVIFKKYVEWVLFNDDFQVEDRSSDGKVWAQSGEPLDEEEVWKNKKTNFICFVSESGSLAPYCVSFGKSSSKNGRKLSDVLNKMTQTKGLPIFARKIKIFSEEATSGKFTYQTLNYEYTDEEPPTDVMDQAMTARETIEKILKSGGVDSEHNGESNSDAPPPRSAARSRREKPAKKSSRKSSKKSGKANKKKKSGRKY